VEIARQKGLELRNAEKDYLLEIILYATSDFRRFLVFKGGTALYKFYSLNRFSEDLDFDVVGKKADFDRMITGIAGKLDLLGMRGTGIEREEYGNETTFRLAVRGPLFDGGRGSMSRITINISKRERPELFADRMLMPFYQEIPSFNVSVLDPNEIASEKVRCILTREKPRDVYDLWFLLKRGMIIDPLQVNRKCKIYGINYEREALVEKMREKNGMWTRDLKGFIIGQLPSFDTLDILVDGLHGFLRLAHGADHRGRPGDCVAAGEYAFP